MSIPEICGKSPPLIEYRNVTLIRNKRNILDGISLSIDAGEHVAILGPNGAGKSSLIKTITRELHPIAPSSDSYLRVLGKELWNVTELRGQLGIVGSDVIKSNFADFSCQEIVLSGFFSSTGIWPYHQVTYEMKKKAKAAMRLMGIGHLGETSINEISTGESRLVMISRALVNDPLTMLLDEPTSSLDPQAARKVRRALRRISSKGKSIVMITHTLSDIIPEIRRVVLIRNGRVVQDGDKDRTLTAESLSALFGTKLEVMKRDGYFFCW